MPRPTRFLPAGKLPLRTLKRLLGKYAAGDGSIVVGPGIGMDAAVIRFKGPYLIAKTDPITFVAEDIGTYTIHINANDIASMGGVPRWFLAAILLPEGSATARDAERVFSQLSKACRSIGASLCGGHTEITPGIDRPIVVGQMLGLTGRQGIITSSGGRPGDALILTKGIAIEGTSIMARTHERELKGEFGPSFVSRCRNFIKNPGISVLKDSRAALSSGSVHAMHDPTEGGLSGGIHELAIASKCGIIINRESVHVFPETLKICGYFGIDPLGVIASGSLLIAVPPGDALKVVKGIERSGVRASVIGSLVERKKGVKISEGGKIRPLVMYERDEITRIL